MAGEHSTSCCSLLSVAGNRRAVSGISDFQPTGKLKSCWVGAGKTKVIPFKAQPREACRVNSALPRLTVLQSVQQCFGSGDGDSGRMERREPLGCEPPKVKGRGALRGQGRQGSRGRRLHGHLLV